MSTIVDATVGLRLLAIQPFLARKYRSVAPQRAETTPQGTENDASRGDESRDWENGRSPAHSARAQRGHSLVRMKPLRS